MKGFATGFLNFILSLSIAALGLAFMLNVTVLNPDFVIAELDKIDPYSLVKEQAAEQLTEQLPPEFEFMSGAIEKTFTDLEPWLKAQVNSSIYSFYDYILGKSESLSIVITTEPIKESLKDNLWEALQESPPPELAGLPPAMVEQYFNQLYEQEIASQIPSTFNLASLIPAEVMGILEQVRQYAGYVQIALKGLIALTIALIAGIILLKREVRGSARMLGKTFLVYGAIGYGGIFAVKHFAGPQIAQLGYGLPSQLQTMIPQLLDDLVAPLQMFTLGFLIAGIALVVVSKVYKPRRPIPESESP